MALGLMLAAPAIAGAQSGKPTAAMATMMQNGVAAALKDSAAGWNAGNLDRFVAIYAPDATFVTPGGLVQGRAAIAEHYRPSFTGGTNKRGTLSFETLGSRVISPAHLLLWARWTLTPADPAAKAETGMTTLLFEHRPEGWRIISDHSS
ncbi:SgcJ/EcaC family oxidoreductase [Sphingomonas oligophenolica]|uniref:SgcJ/EcaC family oxidoreductase n=2 Tax=Sphingomonas oligophenolica TaxID=301154 RepID=A0ABU9Y4L4_9SPHN